MIDFDKFIVDEMDATKEEIEPLYKIYIGEMEDMIMQLSEASQTEDQDKFKRIIHNVKGINANMRIDDLTNPVTKMYKVLLEGQSLDLSLSLQTLQTEFSKVKTEIHDYFAS